MREKIIQITLTLGIVLVTIVIGPFLLLVLSSLAAGLIHPADNATYRKYVETATKTPDIISNQKCGDISIEISHSDMAKKGSAAGLDTMAIPPRLVQVYSLRGYKNGNLVFTGISGNSFADVSMYSLGEFAGIYHGEIKEGYVFEKDMFGKFTSQEDKSRLRVKIISFSKNSGVSSNDLALFARCYSENKRSFNTVLDEPILAFLNSDSTQNEITKFDCTSGNTLTIQDSLVRLDGITENIIGTIQIDGTFVPFTGIGNSDFDSKNAVPLEQRNIASWNSCITSSGMNLEKFMQERARRIIYL